MSYFSEKLYELRKEKRFSQEELAEKLNVARQTISKWENGTTNPDTNNLIELSKIFEISIDELVGNDAFTVKENLEFMAGVYQIKAKEKKIDELIKQFKLDEVLNKKAKTLSGGWQRKVSIAISLINDPKILFLDEPTLGLDVIARKELWKIINSLKGKITIILTTHYMEEAESLSDRIGIMANGKLIDIGTSQELIKKTKAKNFEDAFVSIATGGEL